MNRLFCFLLTYMLLCTLQPLVAKVPAVLINEVLAKNLSVNMEDDYYAFSDWIELRNTGSSQVDVGGYYLTNDVNNPNKWRIPNNTYIAAGEYLLIWADEMDTKLSNIHANFKLEASGGYLALYNSSEEKVHDITYPEQSTDISYGINSSGQWLYFENPSPSTVNLGNGFLENIRSDKPTFSVKPGLYNSSQVVVLSSSEKLTIIRYTLDGSKPTMNSPIYDDALDIAKTTVIRAVAFDEGILPSRTKTCTYIINEDIKLPVFSISMNPEYFWDDEIGFYVEGTNGLVGSEVKKGPSPKSNFNQNWRRPMHMEFFDENHVQTFSLEGEVKVYGGWSRGAIIKSLAVYPEESLNYRLFKEKPFTDYNSFVLRNSGNDWSKTKVRDAALQSVVINQFDIDLQGNQPTVLFVNGEFWGVLNIREKINEDFMVTNHGANKDSVDYIESYREAKAGDMIHYNQLVSYLNSNDLSNSANYEYIKTQVDVEECLNYFIAGIYAGHGDWIYNNNNNLRLWRPRTEDGKWRWLLYDTDGAFQSSTNKGISNAVDASLILRKLLENSEAKKYFVNTFSTLLNTGLRPEKALNMIDSLKLLINHDMIPHVEKWKGTNASGGLAEWKTPGADGYIQIDDGYGGPTISSYSVWESKFPQARNIAQERPVVLLSEIQSFFGLGNLVDINFQIKDENTGIIELDGLKVVDFESPIKLNAGQTFNIEAVAKHGYQFKEWQVSDSETNEISIISKESVWNYLDNGTNQGSSWNTVDFDDSGWKIGNAKFGYGDGNENTTCEFGDDASNKFVTTYFRKEFDITDKTEFVSLSLSVLRDDAVVIYLNGEEVQRDNLPTGTITYNTFALSSVNIAQESTYFDYTIPAEKLVDGKNIIAVELHQVSLTSSDLGFDLSLSAITRNGSNLQTFSSKNLNYLITGDATLKAVFEAVETEKNLFINEVMVSNSNTHVDEFGNYSDWIEIFNNGSEVVDIGGMYISDDATNPKLCKIPSNHSDLTTIQPKGFVLLYADKMPELGPLHLNLKLSKTQDQVVLSEEIGGSVVFHDSLAYDVQISDLSFGRYTDGTNNIKSFVSPTPGASNIYEARYSISNIFINEISSSNNSSGFDEYGEADDWIEIYNANDVPIDIAGLYISDNEKNPLKFQIPNTNAAQTTIPAKSYMVLWADGTPEQGVLHLGFSLSSGGEEVLLSSLSISGFELIDRVGGTHLHDDITYGRYPDGSENFVFMYTPTFSVSNIYDAPKAPVDLVINEIMASNSEIADENGKFGDWIEIYNPGNSPVDIGGLYLTDKITNLVSSKIPTSNSQLTTIQAKSHLVLWADDEPTAGILHLGFKLSSSGEYVAISQFTTSGIEMLDYKKFNQIPTNMSLIRYADGTDNWMFTNQPTLAAANVNDIPLQTIEGLFINEFMAENTNGIVDNAGEYEDWIEIYNSNNFPVDIGGMYLTDSLANLAMHRIPLTQPDSTTIPANGFLVLWADNDPKQGVLHLDFKLSKSGEQIGLSQVLSSSIELLDSKTFGLQYANVSYGRRTDADLSWREFQMPTPNASNISTSIANVYQNSDITVFPNPSTGVFNIRINGLNETNYGTSIKVCDIAGRVIYEKIISTDQILLNDKFQFDLSEFTKGTYIIKYNNYSQLIILR